MAKLDSVQRTFLKTRIKEMTDEKLQAASVIPDLDEKYRKMMIDAFQVMIDSLEINPAVKIMRIDEGYLKHNTCLAVLLEKNSNLLIADMSVINEVQENRRIEYESLYHARDVRLEKIRTRSKALMAEVMLGDCTEALELLKDFEKETF